VLADELAADVDVTDATDVLSDPVTDDWTMVEVVVADDVVEIVELSGDDGETVVDAVKLVKAPVLPVEEASDELEDELCEVDDGNAVGVGVKPVNAPEVFDDVLLEVAEVELGVTLEADGLTTVDAALVEV